MTNKPLPLSLDPVKNEALKSKNMPRCPDCANEQVQVLNAYQPIERWLWKCRKCKCMFNNGERGMTEHQRAPWRDPSRQIVDQFWPQHPVSAAPQGEQFLDMRAIISERDRAVARAAELKVERDTWQASAELAHDKLQEAEAKIDELEFAACPSGCTIISTEWLQNQLSDAKKTDESRDRLLATLGEQGDRMVDLQARLHHAESRLAQRDAPLRHLATRNPPGRP